MGTFWDSFYPLFSVPVLLSYGTGRYLIRDKPVQWDSEYRYFLSIIRCSVYFKAYVKEHHTTGLVWNPAGGVASATPSSGAPPPPPGPPGSPSASSPRYGLCWTGTLGRYHIVYSYYSTVVPYRLYLFFLWDHFDMDSDNSLLWFRYSLQDVSGRVQKSEYGISKCLNSYRYLKHEYFSRCLGRCRCHHNNY